MRTFIALEHYPGLVQRIRIPDTHTVVKDGVVNPNDQFYHLQQQRFVTTDDTDIGQCTSHYALVIREMG